MLPPPRPRRFRSVFLVLALMPLCAQAEPVPGTPPLALREAAEGSFTIGAAVGSRVLRDPVSAELLLRHFSSISIENALKPDATQPREGDFTFERAEKLVGFARSHGLEVVGHTLVWHAQTPAWMGNGTGDAPLDRATALARLEKHITGVVGHFRGRIAGWDVVNEALSDEAGGYLRDTPWLRAIGPGYIAAAYRFARAADPSALLFYNDYNLEIPAKRAAALRLLKDLERAGVRVDAVGLQGHYTLQWDRPPAENLHATSLWPSIGEIEATILDFHRAGYQVMFTELDMNVLPGSYTGAETTLSLAARPELDPFVAGCPPEVLANQAHRYAELFALFLKHRDKVRRVTFWGITDGGSWLNDWPIPGRTNHPLLFDRSGRPKPALDAVLRELRSPPQPPVARPMKP